ncbi:MAG: glycerol-3-phosphate 1-O-acyltransferase PlsY [Kiritimatiellae bacterium]|nr:glycerol-3-phosphate 1-O-acyltransferase PlsY [Kiritimatiellia bacterium]
MFDTPLYSYLATCIIAYLLGALPFGLLLARSRGVDIRAVGSGNIGATNVFRCIGKAWGLLVYVLDMLKGLLGATLLPSLFSAQPEPDLWLCTAGGCAAIAGHNWPIYLRFKGGKGIATTSGFLLGLAPAAVGVGLAAWIVIFVTSRYVSLASILAAVAVAAFSWMHYGGEERMLPAVLSALCILAVLRHRQNLIRLLSGTENRFNFKKKGDKTKSNT